MTSTGRDGVDDGHPGYGYGYGYGYGNRVVVALDLAGGQPGGAGVGVCHSGG
ncbi:hypothetical protein [Streptomyces sp. NRRL F-4474]|uniref:hypothetical protein n=1 Tax=Streptomyces sp. NRRL F-4474 TaxID=1463851 RepID=UPI000A6C44ED|nr:hypothetical protein [Streptomyces sp. NRRL F-4474]